MSQESFRIDNIRIDDICRTERYYTATLLPFILLHKKFSGLRLFLEILAKKGVRAVKIKNQKLTSLWGGEEFNRVELITEMSIVRDVKFYSSWIKGLENITVDKLDMVRPDIVIIVNNLLLVIEGKFFGDQTQPDAVEQIQKQRTVIEDIILQFPGYVFDRYCHLYLSADNHFKPDDIGCQAVLTWQDIKALSEQVLGAKHYVTQRLTKAVDLYKLVFSKSEDITRKIGRNYLGKLSLSEIFAKCREKGDDIFVGYHHGAKALIKADPKYLEKRQFKWDMVKNPIPPKKPENWIVGGIFVKIISDKFPELMR